MVERRWFPGRDQNLGGAMFPRCDDPPTLALALDAATNIVRDTAAEREEARGRSDR